MLKRRLGIFGGTFDPIHNAHLIIAQTALSELALDKILFIPSANPPHKSGRKFTDPEIRCEFVEMAISNHERFELSRVEIRRPGPSYMVDTLAELKRDPLNHDTDFFLIIGADNYVTFLQWHKPMKILSRAKLAVYPRYESIPAFNDHEVLKNALSINAPRMDISSSYIRTCVRDGKSIRYLVPDMVRRRIEDLQIYKSDE